jgi:enoyl-CoA hydratase
MSYSCFDVDEADHVAHVQLRRPDELNTMIPAFWRELPQIVAEISDRGTARALVLSSSGRHFSAGMDLAVFGGGSNLDAVASPSVEADAPAELGRVRARMPVLAAVQGGCIGGAVDMVCAADLRYATADAFFCIQEINIGMTADVGTLQRLPKLIPEGVVREYAYTGRRMPAARAYELGFVNEVFVDHRSMLEGVHEIAAEIAAKSPLAVWGSKEMITYSRDHSVSDGLNYIATWQAGMFHSQDMIEEFTAKAAKRATEHPDLMPVRRGLE